MARTLGAKDLKKRKKRKKTRKYMKRQGKLVPYRSKRSKTDPIKLWFWQRINMSREGRLKWNKKMRPHINPKVTLFHMRVDVDPMDISNPDKIKALAINVLGEAGEFLMMGFSRGRNKFHVKPVKLCRITIVDSRKGLVAFVTETWRLSRYWFWENK